jgi:hypothetical protein
MFRKAGTETQFCPSKTAFSIQTVIGREGRLKVPRVQRQECSTLNGSLKALTVSQPYASLIASGAKWVGNRTWPPAYRGPLVIHAAKGRQYLSHKQLQRWPQGCVIAVVDSIGCLDWAVPVRPQENPNTTDSMLTELARRVPKLFREGCGN